LLTPGKARQVNGWPRRLEDLASLYGVHELLAA
jgi:ABC-type transporter Mla MlaB component